MPTMTPKTLYEVKNFNLEPLAMSVLNVLKLGSQERRKTINKANSCLTSSLDEQISLVIFIVSICYLNLQINLYFF